MAEEIQNPKATAVIIKNAYLANMELKKASENILKYSDNLTNIPKDLSESFIKAEKTAKNYFKKVNELTKEQLKEVKNYKIPVNEAQDFSGLHRQLKTLDKFKLDLSESLSFAKSLNWTIGKTLVQQQSQKQLEANTTLERAEAVGYLIDTFNQGFSQAMAAAESKYRMLASDSFSQGDWLQTKEYYEQAKSKNLQGNVVEGASNVVGAAITGGAIGATVGGPFAPITGAIGAVAGGLVSLTGSLLKASEELDAITVEMNRSKQQLIDAAFQIPKQFKILDETRGAERILSDPFGNKNQISLDAKYYRTKAEEAYNKARQQSDIINELTPQHEAWNAHKRKYGEEGGTLKNPSQSVMESFLTNEEKSRLKKQAEDEQREVYRRRVVSGPYGPSPYIPNQLKYEYKVQKLYEEKYKPQQFSDEDSQRLTDAKNSYSELISEFDRFDKLAKTFDQVSRTTEEAIKAKEEQKRREEEEKRREEERLAEERLAEQNAVKANTEVLYDSRNLRSQDSQRRNYADYVNELVRTKGTSGALKELEKSDVFSQTAINNNLNTQQSRIDEIKKQIDSLNELFEKGELSAEGIARLIQLEQLLDTRQRQLEADKQLYSNEELEKREEEEKRQKKYNETRDKLHNLKDIYTNASSSQYLTQNLGSFSRYFGQTDPSLSLMKETNNTLKSILNRIENLNINNPSTYQ